MRECILYVFSGPGLAIRVICAHEPYIEKDFNETHTILRLLLDYESSVKKVRADSFETKDTRLHVFTFYVKW